MNSIADMKNMDISRNLADTLFVISSFASLHEHIGEYLHQTESPLLVLVGPTASGKTGLSVDIALHLENQPDCGGCEIINADSRQMYRDLDIGTAKITKEEQRGIRHHLLDVNDPDQELTAARFQSLCEQLIDEIRSRGNVPMLVGGSMLYVSAIIDGLTMAPPKDPTLRARLEDEYDKDGGKALFERLSELDPQAAAQTHRNNKPRVVRAVEIFELSGKTKSQSVPPTQLRTGSSDTDALILYAHRDRDVIKKRINQRCAQMFEEGWIDEVHGLLLAGYGKNDPAMKSHGYREIMDFLTSDEPVSLQELQEDIAAKTRRYARRQASWWRNDKRIVRMDMDKLYASKLPA